MFRKWFNKYNIKRNVKITQQVIRIIILLLSTGWFLLSLAAANNPAYMDNAIYSIFVAIYLLLITRR